MYSFEHNNVFIATNAVNTLLCSTKNVYNLFYCNMYEICFDEQPIHFL